MQVKLLRVLQEQSFERLGGEQTVDIDIRIVAAPRSRSCTRAGEAFREDLFYRIKRRAVQLPPLRERPRRRALLLGALASSATAAAGTFTVARSTAAMLERYAWPGNVRELENAVQRAVALRRRQERARGRDLLPLDPRWRGAALVPEGVRPLREVLRASRDRPHPASRSAGTGGHRSQTADLLGISRQEYCGRRCATTTSSARRGAMRGVSGRARPNRAPPGRSVCIADLHLDVERASARDASVAWLARSSAARRW
jgi:DNA-binding NtrC family response regulator